MCTCLMISTASDSLDNPPWLPLCLRDVSASICSLSGWLWASIACFHLLFLNWVAKKGFLINQKAIQWLWARHSYQTRNVHLQMWYWFSFKYWNVCMHFVKQWNPRIRLESMNTSTSVKYPKCPCKISQKMCGYVCKFGS